MSKGKGIAQYFGWGLIGLAVFMLFSAVILLIMRQLSAETVAVNRITFWMVIFALGIASSVWLQFSVAAYFQLTGAFETTYFDRGLGFLERNLWPPLMILAAAVAISTVMLPNPIMHLVAVIVYLLCAAGWDWAIWKLAKTKATRGVCFKRRCGQLFRRIDGPAVVVVIFWVLLILVWQEIRKDGWRFATLYDVHHTWPKEPATYDNLIQGLGGNVHMLCEPLLAGIIGFHMVLTGLLLCVHLIEWESKAKPVGRVSSAAA